MSGRPRRKRFSIDPCDKCGGGLKCGHSVGTKDVVSVEVADLSVQSVRIGGGSVHISYSDGTTIHLARRRENFLPHFDSPGLRRWN